MLLAGWPFAHERRRIEKRSKKNSDKKEPGRQVFVAAHVQRQQNFLSSLNIIRNGKQLIALHWTRHRIPEQRRPEARGAICSTDTRWAERFIIRFGVHSTNYTQLQLPEKEEKKIKEAERQYEHNTKTPETTN